MKLLNSFFSVKEQENNAAGAVYKIELDKEHFIYKAHFPDNPITPGVCIIQIAQELTGLHIDKQLFLTAVNNIKFVQVISPVENPVVIYDMNISPVTEGVCKVKVTVKGENQVFTKLSLTFNVI